MISCRDVSPNLKTKREKLCFHLVPSKIFSRHECEGHSLLGQRLLFVDADVEVHRLDSQQHPALDLPRQRVKHAARKRDADVEAVPVACDDGQHVGGGAARRLGDLDPNKANITTQYSPFLIVKKKKYLKGDITQIHDADAHILQHGELLS